MRQPSLNAVSTPFGATGAAYLGDSRVHSGTDYRYTPDSYSYAPEEVKVTYVRTTDEGSCGKIVDLTSIDGSRRYRFCHSEAIYVKTGQTLSEGFRVAKMGNTGGSQGAHLHCSMWVNGTLVDPYATIKKISGENVDKPNSGDVANVWQAVFNQNPDQGTTTEMVTNGWKHMTYFILPKIKEKYAELGNIADERANAIYAIQDALQIPRDTPLDKVLEKINNLDSQYEEITFKVYKVKE